VSVDVDALYSATEEYSKDKEERVSCSRFGGLEEEKRGPALEINKEMHGLYHEARPQPSQRLGLRDDVVLISRGRRVSLSPNLGQAPVHIVGLRASGDLGMCFVERQMAIDENARMRNIS
jgi:hypothetical protein